jgi:hypothetical protein
MITITEQIKAVQREIGMRRSVYRGKVQMRSMTQQEADYQIAVMEAVLETLRGASGKPQEKQQELL